MGFEEMKQNLEGIRDYVGSVPKVIESKTLDEKRSISMHWYQPEQGRSSLYSGPKSPMGLLSS